MSEPITNPEPINTNPEPDARHPEPVVTNPEPEAPPRCRALTTAGQRCKSDALDGSHLCFAHARHRQPQLPHPTHVAIPFLEDHASVQLVATQVVHGLLSHKLDLDRARATLYALQLVIATLPRPARLPSLPPPSAPPPDSRPADPGARASLPAGNPEQVHQVAFDEHGPISADGDLPLPNLHWQRPAPGLDPIALLDAAPNLSRPDPLPPDEPLTHCDCPICFELRRTGYDPTLHPHPQPKINPFCDSNQPGCHGPEFEQCCRSCGRVRKHLLWSRERRRRSTPKPAAADADAVNRESNRSPDREPDQWVSALEPLDLNGAAEPTTSNRRRGNTQNLLPRKRRRINQNIARRPGGPPILASGAGTGERSLDRSSAATQHRQPPSDR